MALQRVEDRSIGDPAIQQIEAIVLTAAGKSPQETLEALDRYSIKSYISGEGALFIRFLGAATETFTITPVARDRLLMLSRDKLVAIAESAFGMWADREDISDTAEYVRSLRARWKKRLEDVRK